MTIFEYTKVHIINTLCISKLAFRASIFIFFIHFSPYYIILNKKNKKNLGKYNTLTHEMVKFTNIRNPIYPMTEIKLWGSII
jgi:hypothetical protein